MRLKRFIPPCVRSRTQRRAVKPVILLDDHGFLTSGANTCSKAEFHDYDMHCVNIAALVETKSLRFSVSENRALHPDAGQLFDQLHVVAVGAIDGNSNLDKR